LQAADAFILTSHYEGLPLSVVEAMSCGLPCVVTDAGGNAEAVLDGSNGLVVPRSAVDEISAAMSYLITNPSETARMAKESRARAIQLFDVDKLMAEIERVLTSK
jgi:glycosyltransferase involved in cell wall biosynthesis